MPQARNDATGSFGSERRKIQASGILDALIEYAEGRREMTSSQVSAALGLLKKSLPDLSTAALSGACGDAQPLPDFSRVEIRIVDPQG